MNRNHKQLQPHNGFTLVELLVAIAIIGILMGIAIPAIMKSVTTARQTSQKMEINSIAQGVEAYLSKYGDYPPDGSSKAVIDRHMRRLFPRMTTPDTTLLNLLLDDRTDSTVGSFSEVAMDRGEALVFFLGGFSSDLQHPLTGPGGPLEFKGYVDTDTAKISNYQYNVTREISLFEFDTQRLTIARDTDASPMISTDETELSHVNNAHGGNDLLPAYRAVSGRPTPIVYFDSRTYGNVSTTSASIYNGYTTGDASFGSVRPYKTSIGAEPPASTSYATEAESFASIKFHNPDTYQIVSPGSDGVFGSISVTTGGLPVHFVTETGQPVAPYSGSTYTSQSTLIVTDSPLGSKGFQDVGVVSAITVNGHLDNVTNFSTSTLESDLQ